MKVCYDNGWWLDVYRKSQPFDTPNLTLWILQSLETCLQAPNSVLALCFPNWLTSEAVPQRLLNVLANEDYLTALFLLPWNFPFFSVSPKEALE
jgi:hypothetical protein